MSIKNNINSLQSLLDAVNALPEAGTALPTLSNEGVADDLVTGKELINSSGNIITGTNPYEKVATDTEVAMQADLIAQITSALEGKAGNPNGNGNNIETYNLIIQSDGVTKLSDIQYMAYVNGEYQYHNDSGYGNHEYPITISNVVLNTPVKCYVTGGAVGIIEIISNIDYLTPRDYNCDWNPDPYMLVDTFLPLNSDNGQIIIRCYDDG